MVRSPEELQAELRGLFAFPVTSFTHENEIDLPRFRKHLRFLIDAKPAALLVCCGAGEFYSLNFEEYQALAKAGVEEAAGGLPVIAGVGYGTQLAIGFAKAAELVGCDGILAMPPYLVQAEQEGLYEHYRRMAHSTKLGLIFYQRDNAIFTPVTVSRLAELPNVIRFKEGHGDLERLFQIRLAVGERLTFMNGMPTAEMSAPAFRGVGICNYSSAVFNFVPELARCFFDCLVKRDDQALTQLIRGFFDPFAELRGRAKGYAVSLIKAGLRVMGAPAGCARPPLINPPSEHEEELKRVIERGISLVRSLHKN